MAILERFTDIIKANINELLDKCEDPAKMIDQYLRDMTEDLAEVKKETAAVMAEETRAKRMLDDNAAEMKRYEDLARKALTAGNEGDARVFLGKKQQLAEKAASLQTTYDAAHACRYSKWRGGCPSRSIQALDAANPTRLYTRGLSA